MALPTKLAKANIALMLEFPFYSALCLHMRIEEAPERSGIATMATDGFTIFYSNEFVERTPHDELVGVLAHEGLHMGLGHPFRMEGRDPKLWNIACDLSINHMLTECNLKLPSDGVTLTTIRPHLRNKVPEAIIARLPQMNAEKIYSYLEQAAEPSKIPCPSWGGVVQADGKTPGELTEAAVEAGEALQAAANEAERSRGTMPGAIRELVKKIRAPKVDWKNMLWRFVQGEHPHSYTYRRPKRRPWEDGMLMPIVDKVGVGKVAIFLDTSGSISTRDLEQFLGEMNAISSSVQPEKVWVIPCDMIVHEHAVAEYEWGEEIVTVNAAGRGGTSFKPPFQYIRDKSIEAEKIIYLTDLMGDFPEDPQIPTLWVSVCEGTAPFGEVVVIDNK